MRIQDIKYDGAGNHGTVIGFYGGSRDGLVTQASEPLRLEQVVPSDNYVIARTRTHKDDGTLCWVMFVHRSTVDSEGEA